MTAKLNNEASAQVEYIDVTPVWLDGNGNLILSLQLKNTSMA
jgi:hypothetical protein